MRTKILVTGAGGQLGKTIEELYAKNTINLEFVFVSRERLDITERESITSIFKIHNFDYCINCAAYTNVEQSEKTPEIAYKINAEGVKNLAEVCKTFNSVLIHISTDYVFDGEKKEPYTTADLPNPINEYGKSKLQGEKYIQETLERYFIIRTSWLYSKKYGNNFYRTILEKSKQEKELRITDLQIGCPTDTVNLTNYILSFIINEDKAFGVNHFSDKIAMTWYHFAKKILIENNMYQKISLVKMNNYRTFAARPKNSVLTD